MWLAGVGLFSLERFSLDRSVILGGVDLAGDGRLYLYHRLACYRLLWDSGRWYLVPHRLYNCTGGTGHDILGCS